MDKLLLMQVRFLDDRYHGEGDWPPSPARLFQALVAGNAVGAQLPDDCAQALSWLEHVPGAPEIRAQRGRTGLAYTAFVPNNDLDAKGGDPARVADIRVGKTIQPRHIDASEPITYCWRFKAQDGDLAQADKICTMADNLYQLGRGWDMAWASAEVRDAQPDEAYLDDLPGRLYRPGTGNGEVDLLCPQTGSLASLMQRYQAQRVRFSRVVEGRKSTILFAQAPKARFQQITYNPAWHWRLYDLRAQHPDTPFRAWPQDRVVALVEAVRDAAAQRLSTALPTQAEQIEHLIVGRNTTRHDHAKRVRIVPLPSIGHERTNRAIRRVLVMAPAACPLDFGDLDWAFSGLSLARNEPGDTALVAAEDAGMLRHYAIESDHDSRLWHTVTPMVLPLIAARRRIDPSHRAAEAKPGSERSAEEQKAAGAVLQALRHAAVHDRVVSVRVQREPFHRNGVRAEDFAVGTRFAKERLWHVELRFAKPVAGPLLVGDGRYLGLGLMAPQTETTDVYAFRIDSGLTGNAKADAVASALRRAVMARVQQRIGAHKPLTAFFTGHADDGAPLRTGHDEHLAFVADLERQRLLIIAPNRLRGRGASPDERRQLDVLDAAIQDLKALRAGPNGYLRLSAMTLNEADDPLFGLARCWESAAAYQPNRHAKRQSAEDALTQDIQHEVARRGLPRPTVEVLHVHEGPRGGVSGRLRLTFATAQPGPLLLGKTRHLGGGLFKRAD
ncbi:MAG: type I-U CRISPR-associated protein Cas5/Cas6 [Chromatiales bacterium]|nr:type I-U CRISPR-associated protein Cas5/Cas6 [Chromatiales bacterium]